MLASSGEEEKNLKDLSEITPRKQVLSGHLVRPWLQHHQSRTHMCVCPFQRKINVDNTSPAPGSRGI